MHMAKIGFILWSLLYLLRTSIFYFRELSVGYDSAASAKRCWFYDDKMFFFRFCLRTFLACSKELAKWFLIVINNIYEISYVEIIFTLSFYVHCTKLKNITHNLTVPWNEPEPYLSSIFYFVSDRSEILYFFTLNAKHQS